MTVMQLHYDWLKCALCGLKDIDCLEFHHISRNPEKIVVLCANHHTKIHRDKRFAAEVASVLVENAFPRTFIDSLKGKMLRKAKKGISCQDIESFILSIQR
jgi:hypothetical protein